jgi:hypothetical protein
MLNVCGILQSDLKYNQLKNLKIGDKVSGWGNTNNIILKIEPLDFEKYPDFPIIDTRKIPLYKINNIPVFITSFQPVMTTEGWKSINPALTLIFQPQFGFISRLQISDTIFLADTISIDNKPSKTLIYKCQSITNITIKKLDITKYQLYIIDLLGNNSYHINGLVLHCLSGYFNNEKNIIDNLNSLDETEIQKLKHFFVSHFKELQKIMDLKTVNIIAKHLGIKFDL